MPSLTAGKWIISLFSQLWAYNFSFFLSYQDSIQLDIAEVETALFNVKIASHLAASQILTRWNHFLSGFWRFDFSFLQQHGHWTAFAGCIVDSLKNEIVLGKHDIRLLYIWYSNAVFK